jgi:cytosine/adenosine deaminase-related metal-dependent hydrolase
MITLIKGSWVVGYDGEKHRIITDGEVVFEDDRVIYVGKNYEGSSDHVIDAKGKLVSPGFINIHAVTSICITHFRIDGVKKENSMVDKAAMMRNLSTPINHLDGKDLKTSAKFSIVELLKGGATTIGEITAFGTTGFQPPVEQPEEFVKVSSELGLRSYISHPYTDMKKFRNDKGETEYFQDLTAGFKALDEAVKFVERHEGTHDDLIRTMMFPYMFDACSTELLIATREKADALDIPVHMHAAQYPGEYYEALRRYGKTPVHHLHDIGFLSDKTILTHLLFTSLNPQSQTPGLPLRDMRDIKMLAEKGVTLGHTPLVWARIGIGLHTYAKFRDAGVNIGIGTDAWPMDMIMEMRSAVTTAKLMEGNRTAVTAADVFNASTLGGAKALGRDDLGKLAPGSKADIILVNLRGFHTALVDDPIKSMVYFGNQNDVDTVIVDGKTVVENGNVPGVDIEKLSEEANAVNQRWKARYGYEYPDSFEPL